MARLKSEFWVKAYIKSCNLHGLPVFVTNKGDPDAGAIFIKVNKLDGSCLLFVPAPAGFERNEHERMWSLFSHDIPLQLNDVETYLAKQIRFDPDIWVLELESQTGQHFLNDYLIS